VSLSSGLLLVTLASSVVCVVGILVIGRARKAARALDGEGLASRAGTQQLLAENWPMVEKTARATGMSEDEIAQVRSRLLGL
jgi:hypothetical protein